MGPKKIMNSKIIHYYFGMLEKTSRVIANNTSLFFFDKVHCSMKYRRIFHEQLNLKNPKSFHEKLQWIKLYDRNPFYTQLADKYAVREYVKNRIGDEYLNELLGLYSNVDEIDFDKLPMRFVLKVTHGCGWNIICPDKNKLDIQKAKSCLSKWLNMSWYNIKGEWVYKNIPPKIICEKYLDGDKVLGLVDYKFLCFQGKPEFIDVHINRYTYHMEAVYNTNWNIEAFLEVIPRIEQEIPKPSQFDLMLDLAKKLSTGINFCRVDFYNYDEMVIFGEITFFPWSGYERFTPPSFGDKLGTYLPIPK